MLATDPPGVIIRAVNLDNLTTTARWHCQLLPHGLFPRLGEHFVRKWHSTFLSTPSGIALIAERITASGPVPLGFLVGSSDQLRYVDEVIRHYRIELGVVGLFALAGRPRLALHFLRTRWRAYTRRLFKRAAATPASTGMTGRGRTTPDGRSLAPIAVITAVVVVPAARGTGIGAALVHTFLAHASAAGASRAQLVTFAGAAGAAPFYERLGWEPGVRQAETTRDGDRVLTYDYDLTGRFEGSVSQPLHQQQFSPLERH